MRGVETSEGARMQNGDPPLEGEIDTIAMESESGSGLRTRSKAAPDWTVDESLILVNEIAAIEADCRGTLSSFQKWKIIVENCNALDVNRNLNQCRRKWDSLLSDYKKIKQSGSKKASFNSELFKAIERYVREYRGGYDTEPDTDPEEAPEPPLAAIVQSGSKTRRSKVITPQKHTVAVAEKAKGKAKAKAKARRRVKDCSSEQGVDHRTNTLLNDLTRMKGDQIIICLRNLAVAIDELCKLQTDSVG